MNISKWISPVHTHNHTITLIVPEPPERERTFNLSVTYCMVWFYIQEDNQQALASRLFPVHTYNHTIILIVLACICTLYIVRYFMLNSGISLKGA